MELKHIALRQGRLSSFLKEELKMSSGLMNRLKWQNKLFVNGCPQRADYPVQIGDVITVPLDEETPQYPAEDAPITILYEDDHILAVDKPAGMLIHPSRATMTGTLANRVLGYYAKTGQNCAFHPVTRLDRDTFGVVLLAKNAYIHALLNETDLQKTYHALVFGSPTETAGIIDHPIARKPLPSLLRQVSPQGKPCLTRFSLLEKAASHSLLALQPITGRTHQLRVHCAYQGFPILGDPQYGSEESRAYAAKLGYETQQLCAKTLDFIHPITAEPIHLVSYMAVRV